MIQLIKAAAAAWAALNSGAVTQNGPLTLDEAISIGENNAFAVSLQKSVIEKNQQKVNQAMGVLGPQLSVGANYTRYGQAYTTQFGQQTIVIQPIDNKTANATLTWQLDIAGNFTRLLRASRLTRDASKLTLFATYNDTRLNVRQAYFNVLRAKAQVKVDEDALKDAQGRLDQGQKQFDQQQVAKLDVTRYQAQVAQSQADLISAQNSLVTANYSLNLTLARPIQTPVNVVDVTEMPSIAPSEDDLVKAGQAKRPEVLSAEQNLRSLALITRATEATMNPSLQLSVNYQHTFDVQAFTSQADIETGMLALNIPIFDMGITRAKVKQARQDEVQARISLDQTKLQISDDVRSAVSNINSAKARLDNATAQVGYAEEVFRLAKVKQDAGAGTYYEVIDAEAALTQARSGLVNARYDYLTGFSQLQRAVGSDDIAAAVKAAMMAPKRGK